MSNKLLLSIVLTISAAFVSQTAFAADECKDDSECKDGTVCIMAVTPHICKAPQEAGAACKRDAVCASKKCEIPDGKEVGACK